MAKPAALPMSLAVPTSTPTHASAREFLGLPHFERRRALLTTEEAFKAKMVHDFAPGYRAFIVTNAGDPARVAEYMKDPFFDTDEWRAFQARPKSRHGCVWMRATCHRCAARMCFGCHVRDFEGLPFCGVVCRDLVCHAFSRP